MQLVHAPHDGEIGRRNRPGQRIDAAAAYPERLRLFHEGQIVRAVDHRFALSMPALPSAPSKKSFSSVNSPIFAWSAFKIHSWSHGAALASDPNTPAAPCKSCAFHCVIWLTCTLNCCANSTSVFSPFRAATPPLPRMPGCGSGVLVSSSSLLIRSHHGRCQAKIPLSPPFKFAEPPLSSPSSSSVSSLDVAGVGIAGLGTAGLGTSGLGTTGLGSCRPRPDRRRKRLFPRRASTARRHSVWEPPAAAPPHPPFPMPPHPLPLPRSHKAVSCGIQRHWVPAAGFATPHKLLPARQVCRQRAPRARRA